MSPNQLLWSHLANPADVDLWQQPTSQLPHCCPDQRLIVAPPASKDCVKRSCHCQRLGKQVDCDHFQAFPEFGQSCFNLQMKDEALPTACETCFPKFSPPAGSVRVGEVGKLICEHEPAWEAITLQPPSSDRLWCVRQAARRQSWKAIKPEDKLLKSNQSIANIHQGWAPGSKVG